MYYAGHGEVRANSSYWVGVEGKKTTSGDWVDLNRITTLLDSDAGMRARHVLVIADSCFSGNFFRGDEDFVTLLNLDALAWHQNQLKTASRTAFTSGANEPVLDRTSNKSNHSVFAKELIRRLQNQQRVISAGKLHGLVGAEVFARANRVNQSQSPQYGSIKGTGHLGGDFIFIPRHQYSHFLTYRPGAINPPSSSSPSRGSNSADSTSKITINGLSREKQQRLNGCNNGDMNDCFSLGNDFRTSDGVKQNDTKARELYLKACDGGSAAGCNNLGYLYDEGLGVTQNYSKARELYLKACDGGDANGCTNLGVLYGKGLGVTQNYVKARELYLKGCNGGSSTGCYNLGVLYENGNGVTKDILKSLSFYQKACNLGYEKSCNKLN